MTDGYDEETYFRPHGSRYGPACEVYGQDGYGWYTYADDCAESFPKVKTRPSSNSLFCYLIGMTSAKLRARGFIQ